MSLLGTPVYANTTTPLWVSSGGATLNGNLVIRQPNAISWIDASGNTAGRIVTAGPASNSTLYLQNNTNIAFGQIGQSATNTALTINAFGTDDLFEVGGQVQASYLALSDHRGIGVATIPIGQSSVNVTFSPGPLAANPLVYVTHTGTPSSGPTYGSGQGTPLVGNISTTGFTITLVDGNGITQVVQDTPVVLQWLAIVLV